LCEAASTGTLMFCKQVRKVKGKVRQILSPLWFSVITQ
jgi:hypothetical protein